MQLDQASAQVWVLDDDSSIRWVLERALARLDAQIKSFEDADSLYQALANAQPQVLLTDIRMPGEDGLQVLAKMQEQYPQVAVIVMTAHSDLDSAVSAFQGGAFEYIAKPFDIDELLQTVRRALERSQIEAAPSSAPSSPPETGIIGNAPAMQEVFRAIGRLSQSSVTVLINGASGTGKELVARALHQHSPRAKKAFIALNMAAIPAELIESELFGHEKGAFTGATQRRHGRFEQAHGGTLFLDEIGDMPMPVQTRLLRVLAEGQFYPVGSYQPVQVDVRVIAATHQNLEQRVSEGLFREDLLHRLNVIRLTLPRLAERRSDIPQLAQHFMQRAAEELGAEPKQLSSAALEVMQAFDWPGNVRQLENTCRWLTVMAPSNRIDVSDLPNDIKASSGDMDSMSNDIKSTNNHVVWQDLYRRQLRQQFAAGQAGLLAAQLPTLEAIALHEALEFSGGHKQDAAKLLGWGRNTLTRKQKELAPLLAQLAKAK